MCILCIASRWSRHIAAMVMPMVTLWAISQFLPQGFRFEINSPKLACVGVVFVSLSWVELVMPRLSAWRKRRTSALKERRRLEEQEATKRRKKATRRCRNCFTAYKEQTPASGRFMCTFCGHVSKRPVLDPPAGASKSSSSFSFSGSAAEFLSGSVFLSVSPRDWYDRALFVRPSWGSGTSWIGVGPWIDGASWGVSASWFGGSWSRSGFYFGNTAFSWPGSAGNLLGDGVFGGERWFAGDSYAGVVCFVFRAFSQLIVFTLWVWRKLSGTESGEENGIDGDTEDLHSEDMQEGSSYESKDKKVRRKAEEKRLARLKKEHQEAEEKKQREEIARLVEERRHQRLKKSGTVETTDAKKGKVIEAKRKNEKSQVNSLDMGKVFCRKEIHNVQDNEKLTRKVHFGAPNLTKPVQNMDVKCKEENVKAASTFFSRWSAFRSQRSTRNRPFSISKNAAKAEQNPSDLLPEVASSSKPFKMPAPAACSSLSSSCSSTELNDPGTNGMARTETPWVKVVCHGTLDVAALEDARAMHSLCKEEDGDENDSNIKACLDKNVSRIRADFLQQTESAASAFENIKDHHPFSGRGLQSIDPFVGQDREIGPSNFKSHDYMDATTTNTSVSCKDSMLALEPSQFLLPGISSDMTRVYSIDTLGSTISRSDLNDFAAIHNSSVMRHTETSDIWNSSVVRPTEPSAIHNSSVMTPTELSAIHNSSVVRPTEPSATLMTDIRACLALSNNVLPVYKSLEMCSSCQSWKPNAVSVNQNDLVVCQEGLHHDSLMNPVQMDTLTVNGLFQQNDDPDQETHFDPEFYLPSSLFSFEESESRQCCCEDHMPGKISYLKSGEMEAGICTWEEFDVYNKVPPEFMDCITHSLMQDPVITADGHSYERSAIENWLKSHDTSPKTGEILPPPPGGKGIDKTLRPNHILRCQIIEFRERLFRRFGHSIEL